MQPDLSFTIFTVIVLIYSVVMHEVAHGYAAYALGDPTAKIAKRLTLNPFRHVDLWGTIIIPGLLVITHSPFLFGYAKPVPYNPFNLKNQRWGESIVAVAGVATNFILALIFAGVTRYAYAHGAVLYSDLASMVVLTNLFLGFFNLIPIPPLDGYTFLRGFLPLKSAMAFREFEDRVRKGGFLTLFVFLIVFSYFLSGPFDLLVTWVFRILVGQ